MTRSPPADAKAAKADDPPAFDTALYKNRNVVERSFAATKQRRALATRDDKHALIYRGAVILYAILAWLRRLGDMPYFNGVRRRAI